MEDLWDLTDLHVYGTPTDLHDMNDLWDLTDLHLRRDLHHLVLHVHMVETRFGLDCLICADCLICEEFGHDCLVCAVREEHAPRCA